MRVAMSGNNVRPMRSIDRWTPTNADERGNPKPQLGCATPGQPGRYRTARDGITKRQTRATPPMVFPALVFPQRPPHRPTPGPRAFRSLSAQERMLEASAIIEPRKFAHHVSDDRRPPRIRPFTGLAGTCVASCERAHRAGRERPGVAPRQIDNQETR
ncbi:hypothetical protein Bamb_1605 [Burkholderia ambifaria AMMD]|uniref:Uncharacterized protein n=1 Tax=Burkholderia ambifaria (strain ATCC BAA-244 / DSM 16087 / CCUG 44356 / LMG 19182 / AMMD) TaxID=339670 RepID=Q0BFB0_BURCM|nr:hypothetical protein Bamb_1605 [Burkholderia ambifaria AMMD]